MNFRRAFDIAFVGLKPGIHEFEFEIGDKFFEHFGSQDFLNCHTNIKLFLDKKNGFMLLRFDVDGNADVTCDRCGNPLSLRLWEEFNIVVKMVEDPELMNGQEDDPDVYYISKGESHINVADWIYEFINLSVPMQKMCGENEIGGSKCNKEVLEKLRLMEEEATKHQAKESNPLWKGLEKFKDLE